MRQYDYIISGAGASGLMLAYRMAKDPFFAKSDILIIDKENKTIADHIWCYWDKKEDLWAPIISKEWYHILFGSPHYNSKSTIAPYSYKMVRSTDFYSYIWNILDAKSNISFVQEALVSIEDQGTAAIVTTAQKVYSARKVLNSVLLDHDYRHNNTYPLINQHFVGWFIKTKNPVFDPEVATFMDFDISQKRNTRFMYVLPTSSTEALLEYTLFSKVVLENKEYEEAIRAYLKEKNITDYEVLETEYGSIPMTNYVFHSKNTKNVLHMGTAGGWTKASTGYTFRNATKKTQALISFLKTEKSLNRFAKRNKFWFYDLLLLDILAKHNETGASLFTSMFKKSKVTHIFKFLDEETSIFEDIKIMSSMPQWPFVKALFSRIWKTLF